MFKVFWFTVALTATRASNTTVNTNAIIKSTDMIKIFSDPPQLRMSIL